MKRALVALVILCGILLVLPQLFLPAWTERSIERGVTQRFPGATGVEAKIASFPALQLALGRATSVELNLKRVPLHGLTVDSLVIHGQDLVLDLPQLVSGTKVQVKHAKSLSAVMVVTERDINEYLWRQAPEARGLRVRLNPGGVVLEGTLNVLGRNVSVQITGYFRLGPNAVLQFVPQDVMIEGARVPQVLVQTIFQQFALPLDLTDWGLPLAADSIELQQGRVVITGTMTQR